MANATQSTKLSRDRDQRRALHKGLAEALIIHERIVTTRAKARALRPYIEKLVTAAKTDSNARRRRVGRKLSTQTALSRLFDEIAPRFRQRPGGYTRIERVGYRRGDDAAQAAISFVNEPAAKTTKGTAAKQLNKSASKNAASTKPAVKTPSKSSGAARQATRGSRKATTAKSAKVKS